MPGERGGQSWSRTRAGVLERLLGGLARRPLGQRAAAAAARERGAAKEDPAPGVGEHVVQVEAEIVVRSVGRQCFFVLLPVSRRDRVTLEALEGDGGGRRSQPFFWSRHGHPPRTSEFLRIQAELRTRIVREGWEPHGRGETWFAERFRRSFRLGPDGGVPRRG